MNNWFGRSKNLTEFHQIPFCLFLRSPVIFRCFTPLLISRWRNKLFPQRIQQTFGAGMFSNKKQQHLKTKTMFGLGIIGLAIYAFTIYDVITSGFGTGNDKIVWILVVIFLPFLGTILWFLFGRKNRI
ncbi:hypothetical protein P872_03055 [Rhodonellum psychrophilum GCM71 = DSM 17998]|uniref:Cardiolipin synthase N-terminal domain-containing protein n=3 Tax=Cytophagaceae TaxID=89373 RepID=U5C5X9_9BACT|nr:hypothetical protein P872_03055 [Rhodonellum psychrophilum GCM71 = DSM 17998]SDY49812.1 Phospholipase_D-nuclease N-terminal [Rhodonellum ikkaensis]